MLTLIDCVGQLLSSPALLVLVSTEPSRSQLVEHCTSLMWASSSLINHQIQAASAEPSKCFCASRPLRLACSWNGGDPL